MPLDRDVVVNIDGGFLPLSVDVTRGWKRLEGWLVETLEELLPGRVDGLELAVVDPLQQFPDGLVDLGEAVVTSDSEARRLSIAVLSERSLPR